MGESSTVIEVPGADVSPPVSGTDGPGQKPLTEAEKGDPRFVAARENSGGEVGREMLEHAAMGAELDEVEERAGLDWLLGDPPPTVHEVTVQYETPTGLVPITFVLNQVDARKLDAIERRHLNQSTGVLDKFSVDTEVVAEATRYLIDSTGRKVELTSEEFRTVKQRMPDGEVTSVVLASGPMALERRFKMQLGLLGGVAMEVRRAAGFDPERVGKAQRRLVEASLG